MTTDERRATKARLVASMLQGHAWQEAVSAAGLPLRRSAAYRLTQRVRVLGEVALHDQRHGHASKMREPVRQWLADYGRRAPGTPSRVVQEALRERCGLTVSMAHLNRVRATRGVGSRLGSGGEKDKDKAPAAGQQGAPGVSPGA
jgi:transposase